MIILTANIVIEMATKNDGIIFGGWLRDIFSGVKTSKDIDVFFPTKEKALNFILELTSLCKINVDTSPFTYGSCNTYNYIHYERLILTPESCAFDIDLIIPRLCNFTITPETLNFGKNDVDVNMLVYSRYGLNARDGNNLFSILENCSKKQFVRLSNCTQIRCNKLLMAGWKRKGEKNVHP